MKALILLTAIIGVMFAIPTYLILIFIIPEDAFRISLIAGGLTFLLMFVFLDIHTRLERRKYSKFESKIKLPVFCKASGNFRFDKKVRNGKLYFCEGGMIVIAFLDEKPYKTEELLLQNVEKFEFDGFHADIFVADGRKFFITMPDAPEVQKRLKEKGWVV